MRRIYRGMGLSLLAATLVGGAPAAAQEITASALLPEAGWPVGEDMVSLDGDLIVLLPPTETRRQYLLERRSPDLSERWSEVLDLSYTPGGGGLYDPEAGRESWTSVHPSGDVIWVFYMDALALMARAIDPATGAASDARLVARVGDERDTRQRFASTKLSGSHPHPGAVPFAASESGDYFVVGVTGESGEQAVKVLDNDLNEVSAYDLQTNGLYQVRLQVTDSGDLLMTGTEKGGTELIFVTVPMDGEYTSAFMELGDRRTLRDQKLVQLDDGSLVGAALSGTPGNRIDALHIFGISDGQVSFSALMDDEMLKTTLDKDTLLGGLGFRGLDGFVRLVHAELDPEGNLLVGFRSLYAEEGKNTTTELNRFSSKRDKAVWAGEDTTLMSFTTAGELRWAIVVPTSVKVDVPFELSVPTVFSDDALRMVYRANPLSGPTVNLLDISLADGSHGDPIAFTPRYASGGSFMAPLVVSDSASEWLVTTRVAGKGRIQDRTLVERVDLSRDLFEGIDPAPDAGASKADPTWQVGSAAGYAAGFNNARRDRLRGIGYGLAGGLVGVYSGVNVAQDNGTGAGVFTMALLTGGSVYAAGRFGGKPSADWWTTQSGTYQAGYIDGYQAVSQKRSRRWALLTGGAAMLVGVAIQ